MTKGNVNYFRHSFNASEDPKIQGLMDDMGVEGYGYFFILLEIYAKGCESEHKDCLVIHKRVIAKAWRRRTDGVDYVLSKMSLMHLLLYHYDPSSPPSMVTISIPNMSKYIGKYKLKDSKNALIKEKEIKEKEINIAEKPSRFSEKGAKEIIAESKASDDYKNKIDLKDKARNIREAYIKSFKSRYGTDPIFSVKENKLVYSLLGKTGYEKALFLAGAYPNYNDPWHVMQKHPFAYLIAHAQKIDIEINNPARMFDSQIAKDQLNQAGKDYEYKAKMDAFDREIEAQKTKEIENDEN